MEERCWRSAGWPTSDHQQIQVPHPWHVLVLAPRMGHHEPRPSVSLFHPACERPESLLQSEAGRRAARLGARIEFAPSARFAQNRDATISVAAQADNLHSVPDFFAVIAAISLLFRGEAGTARIRAFLWIRRKTPHNPPLPVRPAPVRSWLTKYDAGIDERIVAQICARKRAKSTRITWNS